MEHTKKIEDYQKRTAQASCTTFKSEMLIKNDEQFEVDEVHANFRNLVDEMTHYPSSSQEEPRD